MEYVVLGNVLLTHKEYRIVRMVAHGCNNCDIASAIGATEYVTKNYMRPIYDKTGMASRLELALWFVRNNGYEDFI
jgi:DNA-binding NarL/FixJ family response regulator